MSAANEAPQAGREELPSPETTAANARVLDFNLHRRRKALEAEVEKPGFGEELLSGLLDMVPFAGPVHKGWRARQEFNRYPAGTPEGEKSRDLARERFVVAVLEMGLDIGTGGASGVLPDEVVTWMSQAKLMMKAASNGESLPGYEALNALDVAGHVAKALLKVPGVRGLVDTALSAGHDEEEIAEGVREEVMEDVEGVEEAV